MSGPRYSFDEVWNDLSLREREEFIRSEALERDMIPETDNDPFNLDDSFRLLELITALRAKGYLVEPA